jgi:hypothetical protein
MKHSILYTEGRTRYLRQGAKKLRASEQWAVQSICGDRAPPLQPGSGPLTGGSGKLQRNRGVATLLPSCLSRLLALFRGPTLAVGLGHAPRSVRSLFTLGSKPRQVTNWTDGDRIGQPWHCNRLGQPYYSLPPPFQYKPFSIMYFLPSFFIIVVIFFNYAWLFILFKILV